MFINAKNKKWVLLSIHKYHCRILIQRVLHLPWGSWKNLFPDGEHWTLHFIFTVARVFCLPLYPLKILDFEDTVFTCYFMDMCVFFNLIYYLLFNYMNSEVNFQSLFLFSIWRLYTGYRRSLGPTIGTVGLFVSGIFVQIGTVHSFSFRKFLLIWTQSWDRNNLLYLYANDTSWTVYKKVANWYSLANNRIVRFTHCHHWDMEES